MPTQSGRYQKDVLCSCGRAPKMMPLHFTCRKGLHCTVAWLACTPLGFALAISVVPDTLKSTLPLLARAWNMCVQVLPAPEQATWISARMSPCCALVTEKHLVVIDGFEDKRPLTATHIFDIRRGRDVPLSLRAACCRGNFPDCFIQLLSLQHDPCPF